MNAYQQFLASKELRFEPTGIQPAEPNPMLFPFQRDCVKWALRLGKAALWEDCGLGKTFQEIEWARQIPGNVLILAPLAVARQTEREAARLGVTVNYRRKQTEVTPGITITNYEILQHFDSEYFTGVVLDESSILKNFTGTYRNMLISKFAQTRFKLAATATPAPNDYVELGNHAEFLGAMTRDQMLSMFFYHDGGETSKWRLKKHAVEVFWRWVSSWAVMIRKPSDLGYEDGSFILPPLTVLNRIVECAKASDGYLFPMEANTMAERRSARRNSISERVSLCLEEIHCSPSASLTWCNLNAEQNELAEKLGDSCYSIYGSLTAEEKVERLDRWLNGERPHLISKPSIIGMGVNAQHCSRVLFLGLSDSWEEYYQAVRRVWRFGQKSNVLCTIITSSQEGAVVKNIQRKEREAEKMAEAMQAQLRDFNKSQLLGKQTQRTNYNPTTQIELPTWMQ